MMKCNGDCSEKNQKYKCSQKCPELQKSLSANVKKLMSYLGARVHHTT